VGCVLVRDATAHLATFSVPQEYLEKTPRGLASAAWLYDYGLQTSRRFRALKVWMALKEHGVEKFGRLIDENIAQGYYLDGLIASEPLLERVGRTTINIVCFRCCPLGLIAQQLLNDVLVGGTAIRVVSGRLVLGRAYDAPEADMRPDNRGLRVPQQEIFHLL
jgi:glutamate/tyrosine decarboxylase-like PLP-dependent enzyme